MKIFLCAYFLISSMFAFAQTGGGFSNLYLYNGDRSTIFSDVVVSGDTLVAYGISYTSDFSPYTGVVLALFDTLGNHIGAFTQPPPPDELMLQFYDNDLIILNNGSYACTGIMFGTQRAFLSIFNPDGGLHFTKNYDVEDIFTIFPQRLIEMDGGGLLMGGFVQKLDYKLDVFLKRIDATGNEVWSRTYGEVLKDDLLQSLVKIDGNLVVVGGGKTPGREPP